MVGAWPSRGLLGVFGLACSAIARCVGWRLAKLGVAPVTGKIVFGGLVLSVRVAYSVGGSPHVLAQPLTRRDRTFVLFLAREGFVSVWWGREVFTCGCGLGI